MSIIRGFSTRLKGTSVVSESRRRHGLPERGGEDETGYPNVEKRAAYPVLRLRVLKLLACRWLVGLVGIYE